MAFVTVTGNRTVSGGLSVDQSKARANGKGRVSRRVRASAGFVPKYPAAHALYNRCLGVLLFVSAAPLMGVIALLLLATQGGSILYAGNRIGKGGRTFQIYKFRTLDSARAAEITKDRVLPKGSNIETPLGKFLRASRLDELPQVFNLIKGDMNILGPRPVRLEIAQREAALNPYYAVRFRVKPGLVGQTQAYMCHGTSKRLRSKFNFYLCTHPVNYLSEVMIFVRVGLAVLLETVRLLMTSAGVLPSGYRAARALADRWHLELETPEGTRRVVAFGPEGMSVEGGMYAGQGRLIIRCRNGGVRKATLNLTPIRLDTDYPMLRFEPANEYAVHFLDRFLFNDPVVAPKPPARARSAELSLADAQHGEVELFERS